MFVIRLTISIFQEHSDIVIIAKMCFFESISSYLFLIILFYLFLKLYKFPISSNRRQQSAASYSSVYRLRVWQLIAYPQYYRPDTGWVVSLQVIG